MTGTAFAIADAVRNGKTSAVDVVSASLARLERDDALNAACSLDPQHSLEQATHLDRAREQGESLGPLAGVPLAVKDNICTVSHDTSCASAALSGFRSPFEATCVSRLRRAGAIVVAKTNCDEFGMGWDNRHSVYGPALNPRDTARSPGGSSGGAAALVASGAVPLALGSDTGGSVRLPAAWCGTVGLKPTYGRISRFGLVAFASSLDHVGLLAGCAQDAGLALSSCAGPDGRDATALQGDPPPTRVSAQVDGLRVGRLSGAWTDALHADVSEALDRAEASLQASGAQIEPVDLGDPRPWLAAYIVLSNAEAASNLARYDGLRYGPTRSAPVETGRVWRSASFGEQVQRRVLLGNFVLSSADAARHLSRAREQRTSAIAQLERAFARYDLLMLPTAHGPAPLADRELRDAWGGYGCDLFTVPASLGGYPAVSVPLAATRGALPVGVQLMARRLDEATLLGAAACLEADGFLIQGDLTA